VQNAMRWMQALRKRRGQIKEGFLQLKVRSKYFVSEVEYDIRKRDLGQSRTGIPKSQIKGVRLRVRHLAVIGSWSMFQKGTQRLPHGPVQRPESVHHVMIRCHASSQYRRIKSH
jgi:hypothetical protein